MGVLHMRVYEPLATKTRVSDGCRGFSIERNGRYDGLGAWDDVGIKLSTPGCPRSIDLRRSFPPDPAKRAFAAPPTAS